MDLACFRVDQVIERSMIGSSCFVERFSFQISSACAIWQPGGKMMPRLQLPYSLKKALSLHSEFIAVSYTHLTLPTKA